MISDINMPGMNGLDLARAARHECPELKILLITGQVGRYSQRDADEAGADGYIAKPFKNIEILRVLSGLGGR
jgi:CheY-like chemotaxis protein